MNLNIPCANSFIAGGSDLKLISFAPELAELNNKINVLDTVPSGDIITIKDEHINVLKLRIELMGIKHNICVDMMNMLTLENTELTKQLERYTCAICLVNPRNCILEPCFHFVSCESCIAKLLDDNCPVCRTKCTFYVKTFNP